MSLWGEVGVSAGLVHEALASGGKTMSISDLEKATGLKPSNIYLALGWLLREYKVTVEKDGRGFKVAIGRKG